MMHRALLTLAVLAAARAGSIPQYSPATSVSSVYSSLNNVNTASKPIYENAEVSTQETRENSLGGQKTTFSKTITTPFSSVQKYDTRITNNALLTHAVPTIYSSPIHSIHTPVYYSNPSYSVATPVVSNTYSVPITYSHNTVPIATKTYSTPILTKTSGLTFSSTPITQNHAVKVTYSEAPLVSHMTFTGLGTNYAW
ncbi:pupal cuticle protein C1B-like [Leptidea sinapis]|uniref:pupal cuticle protein C1B-like n=1 Tax=Leptidea sinapis TaxID=189913 RepID=UPI002135F023|nr:pupal cuticle protein C1B-like [Leptidea sinapis]